MYVDTCYKIYCSNLVKDINFSLLTKHENKFNKRLYKRNLLFATLKK